MGLKLMYQDGQGFHLVENDRPVDDSISLLQVRKSIETAMFVFWQPFKLDDKNARFSYKGKETLPNGKEVYLVGLSYIRDASTDEWEFFFDMSTYLNLGYRVLHNDKLSLILNEAFHIEEDYPILVYKRSSYLVTDSLRLQADYVYDLQID